MGQISISIRGSFDCADDGDFSAAGSGHVVALEDAIRWLTEKLPSVVRQDRGLRGRGASPADNWAELDKRYPPEDGD